MSNGIASKKQFVGVDLHLHRSVIVRIDNRGREVECVRIDNDPVALVCEVSKAGPCAPVAIEATYGWCWAVDALQAAEVIPIEWSRSLGSQRPVRTSPGPGRVCRADDADRLGCGCRLQSGRRRRAEIHRSSCQRLGLTAVCWPELEFVIGNLRLATKRLR
jgi:hypothetical protein